MGQINEQTKHQENGDNDGGNHPAPSPTWLGRRRRRRNQRRRRWRQRRRYELGGIRRRFHSRRTLTQTGASSKAVYKRGWTQTFNLQPLTLKLAGTEAPWKMNFRFGPASRGANSWRTSHSERSAAARRLNATHSSYFTPWPPKMSSAEPMVRSTLPRAQPGDLVQIGQGFCAAGVGHRERRPLPQLFHQFAVNPATQAFHVHGMDQEFSAIVRRISGAFRALTSSSVNFCQRSVTTKYLPAAFPAAQVEHELVPANGLDQFLRAAPNPRGLRGRPNWSRSRATPRPRASRGHFAR